MIGDLTFAAFIFCTILSILWVIYKIWQHGQPTVLPVSETLATFRAAYERLGGFIVDAALFEVYSDLLPKFDNPYVAALELWVKTIRRLLRPGHYAHLRPVPGISISATPAPPEPHITDDERDLGMHALCDFVIEGHLSHDEGKHYFEQLMGFHRTMLSIEGRPSADPISFERMLDALRKGKQPTG